MPKQHSWNSWARDYSQQAGCMKPLSEGRKLCATCHHWLFLGLFYLSTNTVATRKSCVGKNRYLYQEKLQRKSSKLKHIQEDHQFSTESLGSYPHLTQMRRVLPILNELSSTMLISIHQGFGPLLHSTKSSSFKASV